MYRNYNANPGSIRVGDCTVRAISKATGKSWTDVYMGICLQGLLSFDMPSSNAVWGKYLKSIGYKRHMLPDTCPDCYTVEKFCRDHKNGSYIVATGSHAVACIGGDYFDTWNSGNELAIFYFTKEV